MVYDDVTDKTEETQLNNPTVTRTIFYFLIFYFYFFVIQVSWSVRICLWLVNFLNSSTFFHIYKGQFYPAEIL